jgi:adenosylmethionine-8-amino-7-oxononanoate aminotransferase
MKDVCDRHGALLIFDEVMCGMGRTGTLHAWEQEGVVPDIQAVGKGLGAGYGTISALLIHQRVIAGLQAGGGHFEHAQTYQCHPLCCVAALEVQKIIKEQDLVKNVRKMGAYLGKLLGERFANHPYVGDVRGRGLFWCVEFVANKNTKESFHPQMNIARQMRQRGLEKGYDVCMFSASGCAGGTEGDHFLLAPAYTIGEADVEEIVSRVGRVVDSVFWDLKDVISG